MELSSSKIFDFEDACIRRKELKKEGKRVILTNGCFDLLHAGHIFLLENAKIFGDSLWVAINSDTSVKALKGNSRPIFTEKIRAYMLAALQAVGGVFIFFGTRLHDEIIQFAPDIYVKAGDYAIENLDAMELKALNSVGAEIRFIPFLDGFSTTSIAQNLAIQK